MVRVERQLLASGSDDATDSPNDLPYDIAYAEYGYIYASPLGYGSIRVEPKIVAEYTCVNEIFLTAR